MKLSYFIQGEISDTDNSDLYVEISKQGLSYIILDRGICMALVIYHFEAGTSDDTAAGYIHQVIKIPAIANCKLIRIPCVKMILNAPVSPLPAYFEKTDCMALLSPWPATAKIK